MTLNSGLYKNEINPTKNKDKNIGKNGALSCFK